MPAKPSDKPKMGRPPLPPDQKAALRVWVRFTSAEWAHVEREAKRRGLPADFDRAPFVKLLALERAAEGAP